MDTLYSLVFMRTDNRNPTVSAIQTAWLCTTTEFATAVHLHGASLGALTREKQSWTHFWKNIDSLENGARGSASVTGAELEAGPLPQDVAARAAASDRLVKSLQNQLAQQKQNNKSLKRKNAEVPSADEDPRDRSNKEKGNGRGKGRFNRGGKKRKVSLKGRR